MRRPILCEVVCEVVRARLARNPQSPMSLRGGQKCRFRPLSGSGRWSRTNCLAWTDGISRATYQTGTIEVIRKETPEPELGGQFALLAHRIKRHPGRDEATRCPSAPVRLSAESNDPGNSVRLPIQPSAQESGIRLSLRPAQCCDDMRVPTSCVVDGVKLEQSGTLVLLHIGFLTVNLAGLPGGTIRQSNRVVILARSRLEFL